MQLLWKYFAIIWAVAASSSKALMLNVLCMYLKMLQLIICLTHHHIKALYQPAYFRVCSGILSYQFWNPIEASWKFRFWGLWLWNLFLFFNSKIFDLETGDVLARDQVIMFHLCWWVGHKWHFQRYSCQHACPSICMMIFLCRYTVSRSRRHREKTHWSDVLFISPSTPAGMPDVCLFLCSFLLCIALQSLIWMKGLAV